MHIDASSGLDLLTVVDTMTKMKQRQRPGSCGIVQKDGQGRDLSLSANDRPSLYTTAPIIFTEQAMVSKSGELAKGKEPAFHL